MVMHTLNMPRLGETMDEGRIVAWLIEEGASFKRGETIVEIETDKTLVEYPALGDGKLVERLAQEGDGLGVGAPLARIEIAQAADWPDLQESPPQPAPPVAADDTSRVVDLAMPRLGETMEEGRIVTWLVNEGASFGRGEAIVEIETDKTIAEYPALQAGRLTEIVRGEEEIVPVGETIARIEVAAEAVGRDVAGQQPLSKSPEMQVESVAEAAGARPAAQPAGARKRATPLARRLARQRGVDIESLTGSGRRGRIEKEDVLAAHAGGNAVSGNGEDLAFVDLPQGKMAYTAGGPADSRPVLLVHGFAADHSAWAATAGGLGRAGRRVIAPDLPGHGATAIEAQRCGDLGAPLAEFFDRVASKGPCDIVAHSLGAVAAVALAEARGDRIASLTLVAPVGLGLAIDTAFVQGMAAAASPGEIAHLLRRISIRGAGLSQAALVQMAEQMGQGRLTALARDAVGPVGQRIDILPALAELSRKLPVHVVFGLEDRIIPWEAVTGLPPTVAIHLMSASGHMPQWDQTREFLELLATWQNGRA